MTRPSPADLSAERALLGAAMYATSALEVVALELDPEDFHSPNHKAIAKAMVGMWADGLTVGDAVSLASRMRGEFPDTLETLGGTAGLMDLAASTSGVEPASQWATIIRDHATSRRLIAAGLDIAERAYERPAAETLTHARELIGTIDLPVGSVEPSPTMADLLEQDDDYDWLIPGLLERGDRLIVTGTEGFGKSTLCRQISIMVAAGMHPFRFHHVDQRRVLIVDCENSTRQVRRKSRDMYRRLQHRIDPGYLRVETVPGLDLLRPQDRRWLLERVAANTPDLLVIGPVYKLHNGDPFEEGPAKQVTSVLDDVRGRFGCCLLMESHAGHQTAGRNDLRPYGASLWKRWPEFGYGLAEHSEHPDDWADFKPWRGDRDEREWPSVLKRGTHWPWEDVHYRPADEPVGAAS